MLSHDGDSQQATYLIDMGTPSTAKQSTPPQFVAEISDSETAWPPKDLGPNQEKYHEKEQEKDSLGAYLLIPESYTRLQVDGQGVGAVPG